MRTGAKKLLLWLGTMGCSVLGWGIGNGQAPLPPPPPGPVLEPPNQQSPSTAAKPVPAEKPTTPMIEQLTVPPLEKTEPARRESPPAQSGAATAPPAPPAPIVPPQSPPSSSPIPNSPAVPPSPPSETPAPPASVPSSKPSITPPTAAPTPPSSAVPNPATPLPARTTSSPGSPTAPPALLNPAVQTAPPSNPPTGPSAPATNPGAANATVTPVVPQKPAPAILIVEVPPQATLWIEDQRMSQTGPVRSFQSPPLEPGKTYLYKIRLSWPGPNGQPITTEHEITVQAGQTQRIDFRPLAQTLGGSPTPGTTITPLTPNPPPPPSPPRRFFPFGRPEGSGSQ